MTSAQQAQQAAELAAAKREFATCLAAHQDFQRVRPATCVHTFALQELESIQASHKTIHQNSALLVQ